MDMKKPLYDYSRMKGTSWVFTFYSLIISMFLVSGLIYVVFLVLQSLGYIERTAESLATVMVFAMPLIIPVWVFVKNRAHRYKWLFGIAAVGLTIQIALFCFFFFASSGHVAGYGIGATVALFICFLSYRYHQSAFEELKLW